MKILQRFSEPHLRSEVMTNVIYVLNMALTKIVKQVVHEKNWFGSKALVKHLKIFAYLCFKHVPDERSCRISVNI
jgi:hypothetical protein